MNKPTYKRVNFSLPLEAVQAFRKLSVKEREEIGTSALETRVKAMSVVHNQGSPFPQRTDDKLINERKAQIQPVSPGLTRMTIKVLEETWDKIKNALDHLIRNGDAITSLSEIVRTALEEKLKKKGHLN